MTSADQQGMHITVVGRVQGVCFRAYTLDEARRLALTGWVRNLPDGAVEIVAEGAPAALRRLASWCWKGPPMAVVREVKRASLPYSGAFDSFSIRY